MPNASDAELLARVTFRPEQCGGRPCIRGLRIRVADVLGLLAAGAPEGEILEDYPYLEREDIAACLLYAARRLDHPRLVAAQVPADGGAPAGPRVWVDAQLPPALARWLAREYGVDAVHVDDAGYLGADDLVIFAAARAGGAAVVVTKDEDFVRLLDQHGPPPQVVWVTCGNVRNPALRRLVLPVWPQVAALLAAGERLVEIGGPA